MGDRLCTECIHVNVSARGQLGGPRGYISLPMEATCYGGFWFLEMSKRGEMTTGGTKRKQSEKSKKEVPLETSQSEISYNNEARWTIEPDGGVFWTVLGLMKVGGRVPGWGRWKGGSRGLEKQLTGSQRLLEYVTVRERGEKARVGIVDCSQVD